MHRLNSSKMLHLSSSFVEHHFHFFYRSSVRSHVGDFLLWCGLCCASAEFTSNCTDGKVSLFNNLRVLPVIKTLIWLQSWSCEDLNSEHSQYNTTSLKFEYHYTEAVAYVRHSYWFVFWGISALVSAKSDILELFPAINNNLEVDIITFTSLKLIIMITPIWHEHSFSAAGALFILLLTSSVKWDLCGWTLRATGGQFCFIW